MLTKVAKGDGEVGSQLIDSINVSDVQSNILFLALLLTAIGVFLGGNLLMLDSLVLKITTPIAFACFALLLVFYLVSNVLKSLIWGMVVTYGLMFLVTYSHLQFLILFIYAFSIFGVVYAIRFFRVEFNVLGIIVLMSLISTLVILGYEGQYTTFDMLQRLHAGKINNDPLYHASISAMIKNYGVVSTGLHGLVETPYHILSHVLFASISKLSGAGVIDVYGVAPHVFFAPILIFSVVACCVMLNERRLTNIPLGWGGVSVLFVLAPWFFGRRWCFWNSYFGSESYLVSLGLFTFGLALLFKRNLSLLDLVLVIILAALIASAKGPVGLIYTGLWLLRIIFFRSSKFYLELITLCLVGLVVGTVTFKSVVTHPNDIRPLEFISSYSYHGRDIEVLANNLFRTGILSWHTVIWALIAFLSFFCFHFLFSWIVVLCLIYKNGLIALVRSPAGVYSFGALLAGILIVLFFKIPGGSAYYFTNVAFFVSLPIVVVWVLNNIELLPNKSKFCGLSITTFTILMLILGLTSICGSKTLYSTYFLHKQYANQHSKFVDSLIELRNHTPINIYIRPNPIEMLDNPFKECSSQPFVYPAISERPWINVITLNNDCFYQYYGFPQYGITSQEQKIIIIQPKLLPRMKELFWSGMGASHLEVN